LFVDLVICGFGEKFFTILTAKSAKVVKELMVLALIAAVILLWRRSTQKIRA
jgi:hypothetical protein